MATLSCKHIMVLLLVFSVELMVERAEAEICRDILPRLPGSENCDIENCKNICKFLHQGTPECVDVFEIYTRCMCVWEC
ncbi:defensin-like protein 159 [Mercurialis annua]|uniref:defensin-like protein 159 n=1 Tax=Mercurialis annua TaxID=3986 RepID=UPI002160EAF5|nr:defensin-like protein 159 [Mercurialis annua]